MSKKRHIITENGKAKLFVYRGMTFLAMSDGSLILRDTVEAGVERMFREFWQNEAMRMADAEEERKTVAGETDTDDGEDDDMSWLE